MDYIAAKERAIKYIGISKKTEYEVEKKLRTLKVDKEIITNVIEYLRELGYLNDEDYVKSYIKQNINMKKYSKYELKQKLLQKGIKTSIIETYFETNVPDDYEQLVVNKLISGKLKNHDEIKTREYLYRRGFRLEM